MSDPTLTIDRALLLLRTHGPRDIVRRYGPTLQVVDARRRYAYVLDHAASGDLSVAADHAIAYAVLSYAAADGAETTLIARQAPRGEARYEARIYYRERAVLASRTNQPSATEAAVYAFDAFEDEAHDPGREEVTG